MLAQFSLEDDSFRLADSLDAWQAALLEFIAIAQPLGWLKRLNQLLRDYRRSPYAGKVVSDFHWVEIELAGQQSIFQEQGALRPEILNLDTVAALTFVGSFVEVHRGLSDSGKRVLEGRLRDSLKSDFAGLFLELDTATTLILAGYTVNFPDLEGSARYDISFSLGGSEMTLECKSISVDAGRKIHRHDFYRFVSSIEGLTPESLPEGRRLVVVTVDDRLPSSDAKQQKIRDAVHDVLRNSQNDSAVEGDFFKVDSEQWDDRFEAALARAAGNMHAAARALFGGTCHTAGVMTEQSACILVARSKREDDTSKPALNAIKAASKQLPKDRPGFIALQYEDITARDLSSPSLRRRASLLDNTLFHMRDVPNLAAIYHTAFAGLCEYQGQVAKPAFATWNPKCSKTFADMPFRRGVSNTAFADLLGAHEYDPDDHIYGTGCKCERIAKV